MEIMGCKLDDNGTIPLKIYQESLQIRSQKAQNQKVSQGKPHQRQRCQRRLKSRLNSTPQTNPNNPQPLKLNPTSHKSRPTQL